MKTPKPITEKVLNEIIKRLESTEKFVVDQAPQVCREIITRRLITEITDLIVCGSLSWVLPVVIYFAAAYTFSSADWSNMNEGMPRLLVGVLALTCGIMALHYISKTVATIKQLIIIKTCPKLILISELRKLTT